MDDKLAQLVPEFPRGSRVPRAIYQTSSYKELPLEFRRNVDNLRRINPGWDYRFYDSAARSAFVLEIYGPKILGYFERIDPTYGPARSDMFRYLVMYRYGGVYLDIKSNVLRPLDEIIREDDQYVLAQWRNRHGELHSQWGIYDALKLVPGGEFQQWHIICAPGHPFLRAVIVRVLANIDGYRPWCDGVGKFGVIGLTGPIPYTLGIYPLLSLYEHRMVRNENELGLVYSVFKDAAHTNLFVSHYSSLSQPIIRMSRWGNIRSKLHLIAIRLRRRVTATLLQRSGR